MNSTLGYAVLNLHNIARTVEERFGQCEVSKTLRECADQLNDLIKAEIHTGE